MIPETPAGAGSPTTSDKPIIRVVDDDQSFRTAICRLLRSEGFEVREYPSAGAFLLGDDEQAPGCLLLDMRMRGPSGLDLQEALAKRERSLPVIFLTAYADVKMSVRAMKAGAMDFLAKPVKRDALFSTIRAALARDEEKRAAREQVRVLRMRYEALSPREREVLHHVVAGRLNKQIASAIGAAERTVKAHRARVMAKMQAGSVAELVRFVDQLAKSGAPLGGNPASTGSRPPTADS
jgi:FixJ family two-component response regulator